jgi:hypothetical protein
MCKEGVQSLKVDTNGILVSFVVSSICTNVSANNLENVIDVVRNLVI